MTTQEKIDKEQIDRQYTRERKKNKEKLNIQKQKKK